jgi:splicing factor 3B subunit 3
VRFASWPNEPPLLAVGTTQGLSFYPRQVEEGFIRMYRLKEGRTLELIHKIAVGGIPGALAAFKGRLLAGVGSALRIYDMGKKKLLRKTEFRSLPTHITSLHTLGDRIYVGDLQESFHYFKYKKSENTLYEYADDVAPRHLASALPLDFDTIAGGDKFGNVFITRLPADISAQVEDDPTGGKFAGASGLLNGAPNKLEDVINFHVGDIVTALQRSSLQPGGQDVLVYSTMMGGVGSLLPFTSREDMDFFSHLEMHLRQEQPPMSGRDHLAYRGMYFPVKDVIDGDLCEQYSQLPADKQRSIAEELDRTPGEVLKKLEDIRNKIL